jgi:HSP20 family protein
LRSRQYETATEEGAREMDEIEQTIARVENLYRTITGATPPAESATPYAPIPAEQDPVRYVQDQVERLMRAIDPAAGLRPSGRTAGAPPLTVWEGQREVVLWVDLPGVTHDQLKTSIEGNHLVLVAERPLPNEGMRLVAAERPLGIERRAIPLPSTLDVSKLSARLQNGVLEIRIPREEGEGAKTRAIPVA